MTEEQTQGHRLPPTKGVINPERLLRRFLLLYIKDGSTLNVVLTSRFRLGEPLLDTFRPHDLVVRAVHTHESLSFKSHYLLRRRTCPYSLLQDHRGSTRFRHSGLFLHPPPDEPPSSYHVEETLWGLTSCRVSFVMYELFINNLT